MKTPGSRQAASALVQVVGAIGTSGFVASCAAALRGLAGFDRALVVLHRRRAPPRLLHEDFGPADAAGIDTYLTITHRLNPMLAPAARGGTVRARDFAIDPAGLDVAAARAWISAPDEELGFRTVGWPARLEEVALHFGGWGGRIELGLYRPRGRRPADARVVATLDAVRAPLAAAFERHLALTDRRPLALAVLTPREQEVCGLLLAGCATEAIALRLAISAHTVKDHRKAIFRKLGIASLAELFAALR